MTPQKRFPASLLISTLCLLIVAGAAWLFSPSAQGASEKPNVVIIFADDLGYGDLSSYGRQDYTTPHLDRMAQEGVRLTDFYMAAPSCAQSRAALLTGRYPFRSGMYRNPSPDRAIDDIGMPASELTLAEMLKARGYATTCIGKWHLGHRPPFYPRKHGFDEYFGIPYSNDMRPVVLAHNEQVVEYPVVQSFLTRKYTGRALDFIERNKDRPFFLYLPHAMPHKPLAASEEFYTPKTRADLYADVIRELDASVGEVLSKLKQLGLDEKTLVIFTSDNGPWHGGSTAGLRGMKGTTFEGGIRVPMIARWPGRIPAGQVIKEPVGAIDLMPTIAKLVGAELPADRVYDGRDIMSVLAEGAATPHEALFGMNGLRAMTVRSGKWKLHAHQPIERIGRYGDPWIDPRAPDGVTIIAPAEQYTPKSYPGSLEGDKPAEMMLFDLEKDRAEKHNLVAQHPEVVERLKTIWRKMQDQIQQRPGTPASPDILFLKGRGQVHPGAPRPLTDFLPAG